MLRRIRQIADFMNSVNSLKVGDLAVDLWSKLTQILYDCKSIVLRYLRSKLGSHYQLSASKSAKILHHKNTSHFVILWINYSFLKYFKNLRMKKLKKIETLRKLTNLQ